MLDDVRVSIVQGYLYSPADQSDDRDQTICKIIGRAPVTDQELRSEGPAFFVEFGDGFTTEVYGHELNPWYPVD